MGMPWESDTKTYTGTFVSALLDEKLLPDASQSALIKTIFEGGSLADNIVEETLNSPIHKFERAYKYGRDYYRYGLPEIETLTNSLDPAQQTLIKTTIEAETSLTDITLEYVETASRNQLHFGWKYITDLGYDFDTNVITGIDVGFPAYLSRMVPVFRQDNYVSGVSSAWQVWDEASYGGFIPSDPANFYNPFPENETDIKAGVRIYYEWLDANNVLQEDFIYLDLDETDSKTFIHVKYSYLDAGDPVYKYWVYEYGSGTYPFLDNLYTATYTNNGTCFPFVFFRKGFRNMGDPDVAYPLPETPTAEQIAAQEEHRALYKESVTLSRRYGFNFEDMVKNVHDNPDIGAIQQAALVCGVKPGSDAIEDREYLYEYFLRMYLQQPISIDTSIIGNLDDTFTGNGVIPESEEENNTGLPPFRAAQVIQDGGTEFQLRTGLLHRHTRAGEIPQQDEANPVTIKVGSVTTKITSNVYRVARQQCFGTGENKQCSTVYDQVTRYDLNIYKQLTPYTYDHILIKTPELTYVIESRYRVSANINSDKFLVPLDRDIAKQFSFHEREKLYLRSLHLVVNTKETVKLEWYETSAFSNLVKFVGAVITIGSLGSGSPLAALLTSATTAAATAALAKLVVYILIRAITVFALKLVIQELGIEFAFLAAIAAAVYSFYTGDNTIMTDLPMIGGDVLMSDALLFLSANLVAASSKVQQEEFEDLLDEGKSQQDRLEERNKELELAESFLNEESLLDPLMYVKKFTPHLVWGESPDDFYDRTVHAGNIGAKSIEYVQNFYDIKLKLPDINDTVGGQDGF